MAKHAYLLFVVLAFAACLLCQSCSEADDIRRRACEQVIIDSALFSEVPGDDFDFVDVTVTGDSLEMTVQYGGGCGAICAILLDSGLVAYSNPPQRFVRLSLGDNDPCEALLTEKLTFDLTKLRVSGADKVRLNIRDWPEPVLYEY